MRLRYAYVTLLLATSLILPSITQAQSIWTATGPTDHVITVTSMNDKTFVLTDGGLYASSDDKTWTKLRATAKTEGFASVVALKSGELFLFSYSSYLVSTDGGTTWKKVNQTGFSTRNCIADSLGYLYAGENDPIQRSTDKGATWSASQTGTSGAFFDIAALTVAPNGDIYAGNQGITGGLVYRSTNHGVSWTLIHSESGADVVAIEINDNQIWLAYTSKLLRSTDGGATWQSMLSESTSFVTAICFTNAKDGLVGFTKLGLFMTADSGNGWFNAVEGIHGKAISQIVKTPNGSVFVGTDSGLFIRTNTNSVEEQTGAGSIALYPNPTRNEVTLNLGNTPADLINVYDQLGRERLQVKSGVATRVAPLTTTSLEAGVYFVVAQTKRGAVATKLVIRR